MAEKAQFSFRAYWRELKGGRPGRRFVDCYESSHERQRQCGAGKRVVLIAAAILAFAIALVLSVFPGPAIPFFFIAGGLLATESRVVARFMDWGEVKIRALLAWAKRRWRRLPKYGRVIVALMFACGSAAAALLGFRIISS
jgi:hypothetical protein